MSGAPDMRRVWIWLAWFALRCFGLLCCRQAVLEEDCES